jgi:hypothetical protein
MTTNATAAPEGKQKPTMRILEPQDVTPGSGSEQLKNPAAQAS